MRIPILLAVLALAACTKPSDRIATALEARGLDPRQARCMGDRLADRLDTGQLQRLGQIAKLSSDRVGRLTLNQLLDQLNREGDPKLVTAVVKAGLHCAF